MTLADTHEDALARLAAREARITELERLVRWQAEGGEAGGSWVKQSSLTDGPGVAADASDPLVWVKHNDHPRPPRHSVRLPAEVLAEIASCLSNRADLVSLGKASFELLRVAMRELVERRPVKLKTAEQTVQMFCHRGRARGFPYWLTGNQARLRPVLNLTHLQHISIPFVDDVHYELVRGWRSIYSDRVNIPTPDDLIDEHKPTPDPQPQDRVRLSSLTFTFPTGLDDWEDPMTEEHPGFWFSRLLALFDPLNLVLVRTPTPEHPVARLVTDGLVNWTRLERCICVGVVPEIDYLTDDRRLSQDDGSALTEWPSQEGLPELVVFLVGPREGHGEFRQLLGKTCARRLDEEEDDYLNDKVAAMRWDVQFWLQDKDAVIKEKAHLKQTHSKGISHVTGEHFEIIWRTWTPGANGDDRNTRLFGLPFEEDGWLSQAWFDQHDLE